ncbi:hypothetical protein [Lyngbya confervoides]|uniref:Uncharacterized protein n=1 Tax=Lyngbya confervoides BDU141951 TaxID=1574623 RepID=A0ABD4T0Q3_9CYAN|nr:hypothetical protein [Lyngbya confervoides]MCM1982073.1 hypothetical protein [Lyngbya confervoides BDU141951]
MRSPHSSITVDATICCSIGKDACFPNSGVKEILKFNEGICLSYSEQQELANVLKDCLPTQIKHYLFEPHSFVRTTPLAVSDLTQVIQTHGKLLYEHLKVAFAESWPEADQSAVAEDELKEAIASMGENR